MVERVEAALDKIRPFLIADGGDVKVVEITKEMVVKLELIGACETCPMSPMTMKAGVEEAIKREIPEIKSVVAVNVEPAQA
jgi:Fe-S cluster biogenesis protein NfuA